MKFVVRAVLIALIRVYQYCLSPLFPGHCRYRPTCSQYALEAIQRHGSVKGLYLAARRLLRCHPWGGEGYDPVPPAVVPRHPLNI
ncbi:MAG: membrane protein insertion efficiency factor YidD [Desulfovibrio sp.]|jgi:putative membrane protein insertion efficiency factor|nr:membrane protein insertion efficiency factor YidD [Desulfovibrio sp.]